MYLFSIKIINTVNTVSINKYINKDVPFIDKMIPSIKVAYIDKL